MSRPTLTKTIMAVVAAGALLAIAPPAGAQEQLSNITQPAGNVIDVIGTSEGFTMPDSHRAGHVTFKVSSSHTHGLFALWKLRPAATLDDALRCALMGMSDTRSESIQGGQCLQQRVDVIGGAAVLPGQPVTFTSLLLPGTYYLVNYQDLREGGVPQAAARLRELTITNQHSAAVPPAPSASVVFTLSDSRAAYQMPARLRSGQPLRMINAMPQLTEAVFMPVRPGTTREQMQQFFAAADREDWNVDVPFTGDPVGIPALSPGRTTIVEAALNPGLYALVTWYPNFDSGRMLAFEGQFELVTII